MKICGIDPGLAGALVTLRGREFNFIKMPLTDKDPDYHLVLNWLDLEGPDHIFLERAIPFAMGTKSAFNYGRGFMVLELAVRHSGRPVTYLEPAKWAKSIHEGVQSDLKAKAKSLIALKRLLPWALPKIPQSKNGKLDEGVVDALLITYFGQTILK